MKKSLVIISVLVFCCCINCKNIHDNNSTSDDSMQPIDGYPLLSSVEEIQEHLKGRCIDTIKFKRGETVADVGA